MPRRRRPLDGRAFTPRDYLADPFEFGRSSDARTRVPDGGDARSLAVAEVQHLLACSIRQRGDRGAAARAATRFGFSKQHWSNCLLGRAWMGETAMAAAVWLLLRRSPPDT
ncbi:MAG: hypothetical protein WA966_11085 [Ornithinimicrobium sp.]